MFTSATTAISVTVHATSTTRRQTSTVGLERVTTVDVLYQQRLQASTHKTLNSSSAYTASQKTSHNIRDRVTVAPWLEQRTSTCRQKNSNEICISVIIHRARVLINYFTSIMPVTLSVKTYHKATVRISNHRTPFVIPAVLTCFLFCFSTQDIFTI